MKPKDNMSAEDYKKLRSESSIQTEIMNWLKAQGYFVMRLNSGAIKTATGGIVKLAPKGTGDILIGIPVGHLWVMGFIEVKREKGKLTIHQEQFQKEMESKKIFYIVARSVEDVESGIDEYVKGMSSCIS